MNSVTLLVMSDDDDNDGVIDRHVIGIVGDN